MRVLVLHSDVAEDARADDIDTLRTARTIAEALGEIGHNALLVPFIVAPEALSLLPANKADIVFNMVESVMGRDCLAAMAPALLDGFGIPYTGSGAASMALAADKPLTKSILRAAGLPTPGWALPPLWSGLDDGARYVVKSATEDASLALDDRSVVCGKAAVMARADDCATRHGGRWFAENFVEGREFNVALIEGDRGWRVLPIAEMRFVNWPHGKPRIVGYDAKWLGSSIESENTVRAFGLERSEPELAVALSRLSERACDLIGVQGYARVDFRVGTDGAPTILEVNPNPCPAPDSGFVAAAAEAGWSFADLVSRILETVRQAGSRVSMTALK